MVVGVKRSAAHHSRTYYVVLSARCPQIFRDCLGAMPRNIPHQPPYPCQPDPSRLHLTQHNNHAKLRSTNQQHNTTKPRPPHRPTQSKPTSHCPNNHSNKPSRSYALSAITTRTERVRARRRRARTSPYAPRASDTSAPVTITPNKSPCESTTLCRLLPLTFFPPPLFG
jgi:hypothetical protein